jgi:VWFA-related protein
MLVRASVVLWLLGSAALFCRAQEGDATQTTFRVRVNVVTVPVVVRDKKGNAVAHLTKGDFEIADNGKRQVISNFAEEWTAGNVRMEDRPRKEAGPVQTENFTGGASKPVPDRYMAYVFDDIHLPFADLSKTRSAAERVLPGLLEAHTRMAIVTTSGRVQLGFTSEPAKIVDALQRIVPGFMAGSAQAECPNIGYAQAERIVNQSDQAAFAAAVQEAIDECHQTPHGAETAVRSAAQRSLAIHERETRAALAALRDVVQWMLRLPGERSIVLVSPGFYAPLAQPVMQELLDRAARNGLVIQALDASGLVPLPGFDVERMAPMPQNLRGYKEEEQRAGEDTLAALADATGGRVFKNNNDFASGFRRLSERPGVVYLLGFSPLEGGANGAYHKLKVTLKEHKGFALQARRGYLASKELDTAEEAKEEIRNALMSREELRDIPMSVESAAVTETSAGRKLNLWIHVDSRQIRFQKQDGWNHDKLTLTYAVFDAGGNTLAIWAQEFPLHFSDSELPARLESGLTISRDLEWKPGSSILRVVLRDLEGQMSMVEKVIGQ